MNKLIDRIQWAKDNLKPVESDLRAVFEVDPIDGFASVLSMSPEWLASALHGGIVPTLETLRQIKFDKDGCPLNYHLVHENTPAGPMTEEEAMEYRIECDIPRECWENTGNYTRLIICKAKQLPATRGLRNAWKINQNLGQEITA